MVMTPETTAGTLDAAVLAGPRAFTAGRARRSTVPTSAHRFLSVVASVHSASRSPIAAIADGLIMFGASVAAGVPLGPAGLLGAFMLLALYMGAWYADRSSLETQGVFWAVRPLGLPLGLATLLAVTVAHIAGRGVGNSL